MGRNFCFVGQNFRFLTYETMEISTYFDSLLYMKYIGEEDVAVDYWLLIVTVWVSCYLMSTGNRAKWHPNGVRFWLASMAPSCCNRINDPSTLDAAGGSSNLSTQSNQNFRTEFLSCAGSCTLVMVLPSMATGVWPAKTGSDLQRMMLRSSDTRAISGGGFFLIWCWNRWFVYMWNDIPGCTRPARPDRCRALATDTHSVSKLVMCLFGSYLFEKKKKKKKIIIVIIIFKQFHRQFRELFA